MSTIKDILKKEEFSSLSQFTKEDIDWINGRIQTRKDGTPGIECIVRGKNDNGDFFKLTPEEVIRQYYANKLITEYGYEKTQLEFELPVVYAGREIIRDKRIDIAVFNKDDHSKLDMVIEVKRPEAKDENEVQSGDSTTPFQQMQSYCRAKLPKIGVIANGANLLKFYDAPAFDEPLSISTFPKNGEDIKEWKENCRFTIKQLMLADRLQTETLKDIILDVEQRFGANDSSDKAFDEIFKLIFTKLYDEKMSSDDADVIAIGMKTYKQPLKDIDDSEFRVLEFRVKPGDSMDETFRKINNLFKRAINQWPGVYSKNDSLNMQPATVSSCVRELQNVRLFNSNLEVVDDAFEHLVNTNQKGDMGQYFTPRYVIDMCVKMLNPKSNEKMIDTASGSCGFPMHTTFHVWQELNPGAPNLFTTAKRKPEELQYVTNNVFGIDFSEKSVRVGRMLNIIAGDGHTNVMYLNTLDYGNWTKQFTSQDSWRKKYEEGFRKLQDMETNSRASKDSERYHKFDFDVLMANPPFAGDIDNKSQISPYALGHKNGNPEGKLQNKIGRDILFIERNLNFLKPGGRMAIVLPQGRFNNSSDKYIRDFISERARILAVVGLHGNTFKNGKSGTGTKTSVLFVQKWTDKKDIIEWLAPHEIKDSEWGELRDKYPDICPRPEANENGVIDYPIFFAVMQEPGKDNSGEKIYVTEDYVTWTSYKYITERCYFRKSDNQQVTEEEYTQAAKKSDYKVKYIQRSEETVHKTSDENSDFIKDLFIAEYGSLDFHKKWVQKNVEFVLKKKADADEYPQPIDLDDYLSLSEEDKKRYKEAPILGVNDHPLISLGEYNALDKGAQKYYLPAETVTERTERVKDTHGHIFVKHDLFNHDPELPNPNPNNIYSKDGIAEAFEEFAKREGLSFFQ